MAVSAGEIFLGAPEAGGQASAQVKEFIWTTRRRSLIPSNATGAIPRVPGQWPPHRRCGFWSRMTGQFIAPMRG